MRTRRSLATTLGLAFAAALACAAYSSWRAPLARAQAALPSASASATAPLPGAADAPKKPRLSLEAYAWPTELSPEPKEEEWAGATELESVTATAHIGWRGIEAVCNQSVVREWMRVSCMPLLTLESGGEQRFFGVIWGLAGDLGKVKGSFDLSSMLERFKGPPQSDVDRIDRGMGVWATATLQVNPGSALVLGIDEIGWAENYEGRNVFLRTGLVLDVSWAQGEKSPTILYR